MRPARRCTATLKSPGSDVYSSATFRGATGATDSSCDLVNDGSADVTEYRRPVVVSSSVSRLFESPSYRALVPDTRTGRNAAGSQMLDSPPMVKSSRTEVVVSWSSSTSLPRVPVAGRYWRFDDQMRPSN